MALSTDATFDEDAAVAALQRTNTDLQRTTWQLRRITSQLRASTSQLRACMRLAASNNEGLRHVLDDLERLYPPARPSLRAVKGDDDA